MPYEPDPGDKAPEPEQLAFRASHEVRRTVTRIIAAHLRDHAATSWQGLNFDFTGAVFDGGDFSFERPMAARQARYGATHTLELSSCWRSERKESTGQEHDHVQCVPGPPKRPRRRTDQRVQRRSAAATARLTDRHQPLPPSTKSGKTFSDPAATSYGTVGR